jgi:hypothetical protein
LLAGDPDGPKPAWLWNEIHEPMQLKLMTHNVTGEQHVLLIGELRQLVKRMKA